MTQHDEITTTGLFGYFDILGYKNLILNNDIHYFKTKILNIFHTIDIEAISLMGLDASQETDWRKVDSKIFSDTIILYQQPPGRSFDENKYVWGSSFFAKCSLLHRIAFDHGVPLSGAISFGEYYIDNKYIFGKPIVEAYLEEKKYSWSGTVLCESTNAQLQKQRDAHPLDYHLIISYELPQKAGSLCKRNVLRWDDVLSELYPRLGLTPLNPEHLRIDEIEEIVKQKMAAHKKWDEKDKTQIEEKIKNTAKFLNAFPPYLC